MFAKEKGDNIVIEVGQGLKIKSDVVNEIDQKMIRVLYKEILQVDDLTQVPISELRNALQPDSLLERFAYRKQAGMHGNKDFIKLKGTNGQINHTAGTDNLKEVNEFVGFSCIHYSVTESSGHVELTIVKKKQNEEITFGVRTVDDTAVKEKDYSAYDQVHTLTKKD